MKKRNKLIISVLLTLATLFMLSVFVTGGTVTKMNLCKAPADCEDDLTCRKISSMDKPRCIEPQTEGRYCGLSINCADGMRCISSKCAVASDAEARAALQSPTSTTTLVSEKERKEAEELEAFGLDEDVSADNLALTPESDVEIPVISSPVTKRPKPLNFCKSDTLLDNTCRCVSIAGVNSCTGGNVNVCYVLRGCISKADFDTLAKNDKRRRERLAQAVEEVGEDCGAGKCSVITVTTKGSGTDGWETVSQGKPFGIEPSRRYKVKIKATKSDVKCMKINGKNYKRNTKSFSIFRDEDHTPWTFRVQGYSDKACTSAVSTARARVSFYADTTSERMDKELQVEGDVVAMRERFEELRTQASSSAITASERARIHKELVGLKRKVDSRVRAITTKT